MAAISNRIIVIDKRTYLWRVRHRHEVDPTTGMRACVEVFSAHPQDTRPCALRILFPHSNLQGSTYPGHVGGVVDYREPSWYLNLNRPRVARMLIEMANSLGWPMVHGRRGLTIPDGYALVREHPEHLERLAAADAADAGR